jgi:hypothetical protein
MGYDNFSFAADVINLAVKKLLTIKEENGVYTLTRLDGKAPLATDEKAVMDKLFGGDTTIELKVENHRTIGDAVEALKKTLKMNLEKVYFFTNGRYLIPGLILSAVTLILTAGSVPNEDKFAGPFLCLWLTGWSVGVVFLMHSVIHAWQNVFFGGGHRAASIASAIPISLFSLPFLAGEIGGMVALAYVSSGVVLLVLFAAIFINALFHYLLKAPTHTGRKLLDKIDGFRMFLSAVEKDRMNVLAPVQKTPEMFEKYLPYALALGVEHEWSQKFADVLGKAGQPGSSGYSPAWYSGSAWSSLGAGAFASSLGSSFSNAIASSSTAPGSSSGGGGGGSSGGGGGGGGGGGW